jgi:hypothetical protein
MNCSDGKAEIVEGRRAILADWNDVIDDHREA